MDAVKHLITGGPALALLCLLGCQEMTAIQLTIESDLTIPEEVTELEILLYGEGEIIGSDRYELGLGDRSTFPQTLTILPGETYADEVDIEVVAYLGQEAIRSASTRAAFREGSLAVVTVMLMGQAPEVCDGPCPDGPDGLDGPSDVPSPPDLTIKWDRPPQQDWPPSYPDLPDRQQDWPSPEDRPSDDVNSDMAPRDILSVPPDQGQDMPLADREPDVPAGCIDDNLEPNDTLQTAVFLGNGSSGAQTYPNLQACYGNDDYYSISVTPPPAQSCLYMTFNADAPMELWTHTVPIQIFHFHPTFSLLSNLSPTDQAFTATFMLKNADSPLQGIGYNIVVEQVPGACPDI